MTSDLRFEQASECADDLRVTNSRKRMLQISDGRKFLGKSTLCPKRNGQHNPTWLANEIVFAEFARAVGLRIPTIQLLESNGHEFVGSEVVPNRVCLKERTDIAKVFVGANQIQLVRALLLDLALLNSDRTHKNTLCDERGLLWFVDHDKSLWGDGRLEDAQLAQNGQKPGDLGRLNANTIESKFEDYIGDYLQFTEANTLVFNPEQSVLILSEFQRLPLRLDVLEQTRLRIPNEWVNDDLFGRMRSFLVKWWEQLRRFIEGEARINRFHEILEKRNRIKSV